MKIQRILFPTRFRELSFNSLEPLLALKSAGLKEIILLHVISREDVGFVPYGGYMKEEEENLREKVEIRFHDWQKTISEYGIDSRIIIKVGEPVHEILRTAENEQADLIVVGKKKNITAEHPFAGSHTIQIITRSKVPTLVSKYMVRVKRNGENLEQVNDRIFLRPMLVTDWSEPCQRAMNLIRSLKGAVAQALIFHDIETKVLRKHDMAEVRKIEDVRSKKLEDFCALLEETGMECEPHLGAGKILDEILRVSRERKATMIILGTSGKSGFSEFLHGSVSHEIAKISELPTLLVP